MNRSKDLKDLFRQYLINKRNAPKPTYVLPSNSLNYYKNHSYGSTLNSYHRIPSQYDNKSVQIYFYEWSDTSKPPRTFYQLDSFDDFLKGCDIYLELYQKDIIRNLGTVYITCYTGTKNLTIRSTYKNLLDSLHNYNESKLVPTIQNPQGRWPESDGTFFG